MSIAAPRQGFTFEPAHGQGDFGVPDQMQSFELGRELTEITLGISAFEAQKPGGSLLDGEGLVPLYAGGDSVAIRAYDLETVVASLLRRPCQVFLEGMLKSLKMVARPFCGFHNYDELGTYVAPIGKALP